MLPAVYQILDATLNTPGLQRGDSGVTVWSAAVYWERKWLPTGNLDDAHSLFRVAGCPTVISIPPRSQTANCAKGGAAGAAVCAM